MADAQEKKATFRYEFRDYVKGTEQRELDKLDEVKRSKLMTRFYVTKVLRVLMPGLVPEDDEDLECCIVDGPCDLGIDFVYRNDGHVLIIQTKYRTKSKSESYESFDSFCSVLRRLYKDKNAHYRKNDRLQEAIADIDWDNDNFDLQYVTLGSATDQIRSREEKQLDPIEGLPGAEDRVNIRFIEEIDLNKEIRSAQEGEQQIHGTVELLFSREKGRSPWITYTNSQGRTCYIGRMSAKQLQQLYRQHRHRLFALNIRNYVGDNSTNKQIISTAISAPEDFFFFNNGISAVATAIDPDPESATLKCERLSIINGAQTVTSLRRAYSKDSGKNARNAEVLVRVTRVSFSRKTEEGEFLDSVTRFNNTQNTIKASDFRSNDRVQYDVHRFFQKLTVGGKTHWYKQKRSSESARGKIVIGMEDFHKSVFSLRYALWICMAELPISLTRGQRAAIRDSLGLQPRMLALNRKS